MLFRSAAKWVEPLQRKLEELPQTVIRHIGYFPGQISGAAVAYDPARITRYVIDLANLFHRFYGACRVKGVEADLMQARIALCVAAKNTLANGLSMLKITVPDKM